MQLLLMQFDAVPSEPSAIEGMPGQEEGLAPIVIDLSEDFGKDEQGIIYTAAEFLIISISGCAPKR